MKLPSPAALRKVVRLMTPDRMAELTGAFQETMALNAACASYLQAHDAVSALLAAHKDPGTLPLGEFDALSEAEDTALEALRAAARPVVARAASPSSFEGIIPS